MGADGEGTTSPVTVLECFKTAWIERPASVLLDRCYLEGWKKEKGDNTYRTYLVSMVIWLLAALPAMAVMPSATAGISRRTGG